MDLEDRMTRVRGELVHGARVRLRIAEAAPDDSWFFVVALAAGSVCGYLVALL